MAKGGNGTGNEEDIVMVFTPDAGFDIRAMAETFAMLMVEENLPLLMRLPNGVTVEFEPGCSRQEIIKGYTKAMKNAQSKYVPSNSNDSK